MKNASSLLIKKQAPENYSDALRLVQEINQDSNIILARPIQVSDLYIETPIKIDDKEQFSEKYIENITEKDLFNKLAEQHPVNSILWRLDKIEEILKNYNSNKTQVV